MNTFLVQSSVRTAKDWREVGLTHVFPRAALCLTILLCCPIDPALCQSPRPTQTGIITLKEGETWPEVEARIVKEQEEARARRTSRLQAMTSHDLAQSLIEGITDPTERRFTSSELFSREDPESTVAILWLASSTAEAGVGSAARKLMTRCEPKLAPLLRRYAQEWREEAIQTLLKDAMAARCDNLGRELSLSFLERWAGPYVPSDYIPFHTCPDCAALLLAGSTDEHTVNLLRERLRQNPESFGFWLAATSIPTSTSETELARGLADNPGVPFLLKMALEVFLSNKTGESTERLVKSLNQLRPVHEMRTALELMMDNRVEEIKDCQRYLIALGMLYFANEQAAKPVLRNSMSSTNSDIRVLANTIMAKRWPQDAIQVVSVPPTSEFDKLLLASVVYFHPDLRTEVEPKLAFGEFESYLSKCESYPLAGVLKQGLGFGGSIFFFPN